MHPKNKNKKSHQSGIYIAIKYNLVLLFYNKETLLSLLNSIPLHWQEHQKHLRS